MSRKRMGKSQTHTWFPRQNSKTNIQWFECEECELTISIPKDVYEQTIEVSLLRIIDETNPCREKYKECLTL